MGQRTIILLSLFILTIRIDAQFYDLFQGFQPYRQNSQSPRPYDFFGDFSTSPRRNDEQTNRQKHISASSTNNVRTTAKPKRKTTQAPIYSLDSYTTAKSVRKNNKSNSSRRHVDSSNNNRNQGLVNNNNKNQALFNNNNGNNNNRRLYYDDTANNVDYYTERTTRRNVVTSRPDYYNSYTPRPGVVPASVDTNRPPITNRPPTSRPLATYPIVTDSSVIRFPEDDDTSPDVLTGPDEDEMSSVEKRRYINLAEKMCDKYKSLNIKKVEAIPLLPSPEPVAVNVSVCSPTTVPLVVGGKAVHIDEFPHMALLGWTKLQGGGYSWKCGGSLVSEQFVLTAGHCSSQEKDDTVVSGAPRVVQLGSSYLDDTGALVVRVLNVVRHPKYNRPKSYYDIALVKLVKPVTFSRVIKPACLGEPPGVGEPIIVTGWGRTETSSQSLELRSVSVPIWDMEECREVLGTSRKMPTGPSGDSQICAGDKQGGRDACQGDSGGPAQIQDGCVWRVIAVTSIGRSCGAPNTPALYATVHKAFIAAQVFGKGSSNQNNQGNWNSPANTNSRPSQANGSNNRQDENTNAWSNNNQHNNNNRPNVNSNTNNNYNRPSGNTNNNQGSWGTSTQPNRNNNNNNRQGGSGNNNNNQGSWNANSQPNSNNYNNRQNNKGDGNNNQAGWNTNQQNSNTQNTNTYNPNVQYNTNNNPNRNNNNQNSWGQQNNNNNGNWNGYQNGNVERNNNDNYQFGVDNPNIYNTKHESTVDYGNNRRDYYNSNNGDYDDYYETNREQRNNKNFRTNFVTTRRPSFSWSNFGF